MNFWMQITMLTNCLLGNIAQKAWGKLHLTQTTILQCEIAFWFSFLCFTWLSHKCWTEFFFSHSLRDGVTVPMGPSVKTGVGQKGGYTLLYNEYIVYSLAQIQMKYLLRVQFNFSSLWWGSRDSLYLEQFLQVKDLRYSYTVCSSCVHELK